MRGSNHRKNRCRKSALASEMLRLQSPPSWRPIQKRSMSRVTDFACFSAHMNLSRRFARSRIQDVQSPIQTDRDDNIFLRPNGTVLLRVNIAANLECLLRLLGLNIPWTKSERSAKTSCLGQQKLLDSQSLTVPSAAAVDKAFESGLHEQAICRILHQQRLSRARHPGNYSQSYPCSHPPR